jgi:hypothetical protein
MRPVEYLLSHGLVTWGVVAFGLERALVVREDFASWVDEDGCSLSAFDDLGIEQLIELAAHRAQDSEGVGWSDRAQRKWVLAMLAAFVGAAVDANERLDRLERAFARLGHPEILRACSRHYSEPGSKWEVGDQVPCPIEQMKQVQRDLESEFL